MTVVVRKQTFSIWYWAMYVVVMLLIGRILDHVSKPGRLALDILAIWVIITVSLHDLPVVNGQVHLLPTWF